MTGGEGPRPAGMHNTVPGTVSGQVVQAGLVSGGIHVHPPAGGAGIPPPRQIPVPPAHFTDRCDEVAAVAPSATAPMATYSAAELSRLVPAPGDAALIGNPIVWWSSTLAVVVYVLFKGIAVLRWQRSCGDVSDSRPWGSGWV